MRQMLRIRAYIDGYNLYHAIRRFNEPHLKWVDLWALCERFVPPQTGRLDGVHYYSAYATWLPDQMVRHQALVAALESTGVEINLANFKEKDRKCPDCGHRYISHEEKETDVHLALALLDHARRDLYDRALIISRDSDLVPAARITKAAFPQKQIFVVAPPHLGHSNDMLAVVDGKHKIQKKHIETSLFPASLKLADGTVVTRPTEYNPP
jgi:uncharacterized LabA/DUF88 family protein